MATLNVSSMSQLVNALFTAVSDDVIEILADLDFNEVYNTFERPVEIAGGNVISDLTINGNNHAIKNMDTNCLNGGSTLFKIPTVQDGHYFTVNNLSFLNCHVTKSKRYFDSTQSDYKKIIFSNCVFQGSFQACPLLAPCKVVDSMFTFNIPSKGDLLRGSPNAQPRWIRCWFYFDRSDTNTSGIFGSAFEQCYFGGTISVYYSSNTTIFLSNLNSCCYNVSTNLAGISNPIITNIFNSASNSPTVINKDKITMIGTEWEDTTYLKLVTDEQMHDADQLAQVGFDIIV